MSDDLQKRLALKYEIGRALHGAPESVIERIYQNRVALLAGYVLPENGTLTSIGGGSIKDEIEAMRASGAYDDLFDEAQPAAPAKETVAGKRPGELTEDDYKILGHEVRLHDKLNQPPPANKQRPAPAPTGLTQAEFARLDPFEKIARANEAAAKAQGWSFDGRGGVDR